MDDDLFEGTPGEPGTPAPEAKPTAPAPAPDTTARLADLETQVRSSAESMKATNELVQSLAAALREGIQQNQQDRQHQPPQDPKVHGDAMLNRLAKDPEGFVRELASDVFQEAAQQGLAAPMLQLIDATHQQIIDNQAMAVDTQFGVGTWREVIEPSLIEDLKALRAANPKALADRNTIQALVDRQRGIQFDKLIQRREANAKAQAEARSKGLQEIVSQIPQGSIPRLRQNGGEGALPDDADRFFSDIERSTGEPIDRKEFQRLYHSGNTLTDYLKATAKRPAGNQQ